MTGKLTVSSLCSRLGLDGMKMQVRIFSGGKRIDFSSSSTIKHFRVSVHTVSEVQFSSDHFVLFCHAQGTNGSQLWDTCFAVQAFLEVTQKWPASQTDIDTTYWLSVKHFSHNIAPRPYKVQPYTRFWPTLVLYQPEMKKSSGSILSCCLLGSFRQEPRITPD